MDIPGVTGASYFSPARRGSWIFLLFFSLPSVVGTLVCLVLLLARRALPRGSVYSRV